MAKRGRKKGQTTARVRYTGNSAKYTLCGNAQQYQQEWAFLDSEKGTIENVMKAIDLYLETEDFLSPAGQLLGFVQSNNVLLNKIHDMLRNGTVVNEVGRIELNEVGQEHLQELASNFME